MSGTNTFSVDEYLSGGIDETVIGAQLFERYADPSVIVTAI